jgi:hypothetical protein
VVFNIVFNIVFNRPFSTSYYSIHLIFVVQRSILVYCDRPKGVAIGLVHRFQIGVTGGEYTEWSNCGHTIDPHCLRFAPQEHPVERQNCIDGRCIGPQCLHYTFPYESDFEYGVEWVVEAVWGFAFEQGPPWAQLDS